MPRPTLRTSDREQLATPPCRNTGRCCHRPFYQSEQWPLRTSPDELDSAVSLPRRWLRRQVGRSFRVGTLSSALIQPRNAIPTLALDASPSLRRAAPRPDAPDFERAARIGEFWSYPQSRTFAELLIDCEEDRTVRAVLVGMLREADRD
jgi:hypothetical protein